MKKTSTLKQALALGFIYVSALPVLIVGIITVQILDRSLEQEIYSRHETLAEAISGQVERFLEEPSRILQQFAIVYQKDLIPDEKTAGMYLEAILASYTHFDSLQLINSQGIVIANAPYQPEIIGNDFSRHEFVDLYVSNKLPESYFYWSSIFVSVETGYSTLNLSYPFEDRMIIGQLNLSYLNEITERINIGKTGYTAIFDRTGTVIAHRDINQVFQQFNYKHLYPVQQGLAGHNGAWRFQEAAKAWIGSALRMSGTEWVIGVFQLEDEAFSSIYLIRKVIISGSLSSVALALLIAFGIVNKTMNPLSLLLNNTLKVKNGDYSCFEMPQSYHEINELALHFQLMTEAVKTRESELRLSEAKFSGLLERLQEAVFRITLPKGIYEYINPAAQEVFGYAPEKFLKHPWFIRSVIVKRHPINWCDKVLAGVVPESCEYEIIDQHGQRRWILQTNRGVYAPDNQLVALEGCCTDTTVRKQAEEELKTEKEFIEAVINAVTDTIFVYEPQTRKAVRWNLAFAEISGYTHAEIKSMTAPDAYFSADDLENFLILKHNNIHQHQVGIQVDLVNKNGRRISMEYSVAAILDDEGQEKYMIMVGRDITERKKMELQLQQAMKMEAVGAIAGGIAHEFNNILSIIIGNAELTTDMIPSLHQAYSHQHEIIKASMRGKEAVYQLLGFTSKLMLNKVLVDLNKIIKAATDSLIPELPDSIKLTISLPAEPLMIIADEKQFKQIMLHLLYNSIQAMEESGGILSVKAAKTELAHPETPFVNDDTCQFPENRCIEVIISDTGHGIDPAIQSRIFDPYFTTKEVGKGIGMGLPIVQGIVKSHGGEIIIDSQIGTGTIARIILKGEYA